MTTRKLPTITQKSCETKIAFTTDDYSSLVSAASASITGTSKSSDSDATTTTSGSETDSGNKATATKDSKETSTNMAGPAVTAESLVLGGALAAALFAL